MSTISESWQIAPSKIDRDRPVETVLAPAIALTQRSVEHPVSERSDQAGLLGNGTNCRPGQAVRAVASGPRSTHATARAARHLGLEVQRQLVLVDSPTQLADIASPHRTVLVHFGGIHA